MARHIRLPDRPVIYEINTAVFLYNLSQKYHCPIQLGNIPPVEWDRLTKLPIDAIWFMGVWERSPISQQLSKDMPEFKKILPDYTTADDIGSAYSIKDYRVATNLGGNGGLAVARATLQEHNIGLILDFVPNHVACDHEWATTHPEYLMPGTEDDLHQQPKAFCQSENHIFAHGQDPNFPPWSDVLQLNVFNPGLRESARKLLLSIAEQCDGIRCDMAMLVTNEIFEATWGKRAGEMPATEYWPALIDAIRQVYPDFVFVAEVYWGKEPELLAQGFDYCYDKTFYDLLLKKSGHVIARYLQAKPDYQKRLVRFIENHDEPRAAASYDPPQKLQAAAVALATLEGATMYYDGQFDGDKVKNPVHLRRSRYEKPDDKLYDFYTELIQAVGNTTMVHGTWQLCHPKGLFGLPARQLLVWTWSTDQETYLVVINYGPKRAHGIIESGATARYEVVFSSENFQPADFQLKNNRFSVRLAPWEYAILRMA